MPIDKNNELMSQIGRRLREAPELSLSRALPTDIQQHVDKLRDIEARSYGRHEIRDSRDCQDD